MDIYVNEIKFEDEALKCLSEEQTEGLQAAARMTVDPDEKSFIYLLDDGEGASRVHFGEKTWHMLREHHGSEIILNTDVILTDFWDQLDHLVDTIEGNSYGEAFKRAVKETFKQ